ncbi:DNA cytosine methyltransferase [Pectobacterium brasiliense]|nr:DNA cytosine methyltransferase [Pectobacterium brasiliense]
MFSHLEENRTLSVRDVARLQTFPNNFIDRACQIIGNALPSKFVY